MKPSWDITTAGSIWARRAQCGQPGPVWVRTAMWQQAFSQLPLSGIRPLHPLVSDYTGTPTGYGAGVKAHLQSLPGG